MDIVHVIFQMMTGGMETMLVDIVNEQVRQGHSVEILIVNRGENSDIMSSIDSRVKISRFSRKPGAAPLLLMAKLNLWMLRRRPDIIHLHMHKLTGLLRVMRHRTLFTVHCLDTPMRYAAKTNMTAISEAVANDVRRRVKNAKITVVMNGINTDSIPQRPHKLPGTPIKIVQVSRLISEIKGQDILIDAARILKERGVDVSVTFIGEGPDFDSLKKRAEGLNVEFAGNLPRKVIYGKLKDYDIMCHPARHEGFGLTVAEGMAAGLPIVIPEGGGPWEIAKNGQLAEVFKPGSPQACADAIMRVVENYSNAPTDEARRRVEMLYSIHRMVAEFQTIYNKLI